MTEVTEPQDKGQSGPLEIRVRDVMDSEFKTEFALFRPCDEVL